MADSRILFLRLLEPLLAGLSLRVREVHRPALRAVLLGLLRLPSPYVSDIARELGEEFGPTLNARERRLERFMGSPRLRLGRLMAALRRLVAGEVPPQGRVYLYGDLSNLDKPHARRMQGLDWVKDGSDPEDRIVRGYRLYQVYVELDVSAPITAEHRFSKAGHYRLEFRVGDHVAMRELDITGLILTDLAGRGGLGCPGSYSMPWIRPSKVPSVRDSEKLVVSNPDITMLKRPATLPVCSSQASTHTVPCFALS